MLSEQLGISKMKYPNGLILDIWLNSYGISCPYVIYLLNMYPTPVKVKHFLTKINKVPSLNKTIWTPATSPQIMLFLNPPKCHLKLSSLSYIVIGSAFSFILHMHFDLIWSSAT